MPLSDIARIVITTLVGGLTRTGFGLPLILGYTATWVERTRRYRDMDGVGADFATTTPEYKAAAAVFSQNPRPPELMIGRGALPPTMKWEIRISSVINTRLYPVKLNGTQYNFTSDGTATNDEIATGIQGAIAAAATAAGFTASVQGAVGSQYVQVLANAAGSWCSLEIPDITLLTLAQTQVDPGVGTDLGNIKLESNDWYHLITLYNSPAVITGAATWVEANGKLYTPDTSDTACITVPLAFPATDIMATLKAANWARTGAIYHPWNGAFAGAAWPGACLPFDPGSETWMFKTLAGVPVVVLTPTHIQNLKDKRGNYYYTVAGVGITAQGTVASTTSAYIDIVRGRDWLQIRMQERLFLVLSRARKIAYTDQGVTILQGEVIAQLDEGVRVGFVNPEYTVTAGKVSLENPADKAARVYKGLKFSATIQGAIHELDVSGVLALA